tara:strand:- start:207 stop:782 length:576 start_codon:yes stop_codon:yes gene_type:complete
MNKYYIVLIAIIVLTSIAWPKKKLNLDTFSKSFYDYSATSIDGKNIDMSKFKGKKVLIVNVASRCGYTYQYEDLQKLHEKYGEYIAILGFPSNDFLFQEPGDNASIKNFCSTKYGVTFQMFDKVIVKNKKNQHPLYTWLSSKELNEVNDNAPSWNFCKYLIDENGVLINYFNSKISPMDSLIVNLIIDDEY